MVKKLVSLIVLIYYFFKTQEYYFFFQPSLHVYGIVSCVIINSLFLFTN